jgi:hypothetical protein
MQLNAAPHQQHGNCQADCHREYRSLCSKRSTNTEPRRTLSAAARRKMSLAQKARWAKRASTNVVAFKPKRTMSASARRKIAAAQRARWAKAKLQKKAA